MSGHFRDVCAIASGCHAGRFSRRRWLAACALLVLGTRGAAAVEPPALRIGLTPVFLDDQVAFLQQWRRWLERKLARGVVFVQRGNYREVVDLLLEGKIDFAWLCGFPYVTRQQRLQLVGVPLWRGEPRYQSYLIVPADDQRTQSLFDLRGKIFAYSDPDSNSGFLYPQYLLAEAGEDTGRFFSRTFFTWAHRKVVEAVGAGLADGGAVDGYVWETLADVRPDLTAATRIIGRSPPLGYPPFVARKGGASVRDVQQFRDVLLGMADDVEGAALLSRLRLDGFVAGSPALYREIDAMAQRLQRAGGRP